MKTVRSKIRLCMSVTLLVAMLLIASITIVLNYQSTMSTLEETMTETTRIAAERVNMELEVYKQITYEVGSIARLSNPDVSPQEKKEILDQRVAIHGLQRGNILDINGNSIFNNTGFADREYFHYAMNGQSYVSTPLISKTTGRLSIIVAAPLWEEGIPDTTVVGIIYFVPKETFLNDIISSIHVGQNSGAYILDKNGRRIAHPDMEQVEKSVNIQELAKTNPDLSDIAELEKKMTQGLSGFDRYGSGKETTFLSYAPLPGTDGWSLAVYTSYKEMMTSTIQGIIITVILVLMATAVSLCIAEWLARGIARPIHACVQRMEGLLTGDLSSPVMKSNARDETGQLLRAIQELADGLKALVSDIDYLLGSMAQNNFTVKTHRRELYAGEFQNLLQSVEQLNHDLTRTLRQIDTAADHVSTGASQVSSSSLTLAQGTAEQASAVEELATTLNEVSQRVEDTAGHANAAKEESATVKHELLLCGMHMAQLVQSMYEIDEKSREIKKVVKLIEDIAFQTKILALNAAVEAARAGSAGKGFAVVADEVQNLAGKSGKAAMSTTTMIKETVEAIENGVKFTGEVDASLLRVSEAANRVLDLITAIDAAADEENRNINQVSVGVEQISSVVQTNSATAEKSAAASEELSGQSDFLKTQVRRFILPTEHP